MNPATAYIALGANLGDARQAVSAALDQLAMLPGTRLVARSSLYRTAPVDAGGDDYVNAVARLETTLAPHALLDALMQLEQRHGRARGVRNAPRTLDLDILLYDDLQSGDPRLTLPHPRMHERAFVLVPLAEIAPTLEIPGRGTVAQLLPATRGQAIARLPG